MRYYDSEGGDFIIGSLVQVNTFPSDENHGKIGLIISGADPFRLESLSQTIIDNWLYRESVDDGFLLEAAYVVRIGKNDWIYAESELDLINSPEISLKASGSFA
jgi:hypothetical protein